MWELESSQVVHTIEHHDEVTSVAFSPEGRFLASGSTDKTVKVWELESSQVVHTIEHLDEVQSITFSPDGRFIALGCGNWGEGTVEVWMLPKKPYINTLLLYSHISS